VLVPPLTAQQSAAAPARLAAARQDEQTLRVDGIRQRELDIINPKYPILFEAAGVVPPVNRYIWTDVLELPLSKRFSFGIDQRVWRQLSATASYSYTRGSGLARGTNVNAPVDGLCPQPSFGNIIEVVSDASSRLHQLQLNVTATLVRSCPRSARR
jgi:hypothetical protein